MKHQSMLESLCETKRMFKGKGYSKSFAIPMAVFVLTFTFLWFLWPLVVIGYLLASWASIGVFSLAAWATFKVFLVLVLCLLVSFVGMVVTPIVHEQMKE